MPNLGYDTDILYVLVSSDIVVEAIPEEIAGDEEALFQRKYMSTKAIATNPSIKYRFLLMARVYNAR